MSSDAKASEKLVSELRDWKRFLAVLIVLLFRKTRPEVVVFSVCIFSFFSPFIVFSSCFRLSFSFAFFCEDSQC